MGFTHLPLTGLTLLIFNVSTFAQSAEKLRRIEIDAPDGRRPISDKEAEDILAFTRKASANLVKGAKPQ